MTTNSISSTKAKARTLNVSGPMDVYEVLSTTSNSTYPLRDAHASIVCKGLNGNNGYKYQVKLSAYANEASLLQTDGVYVMKSRMIAPNVEDNVPTLYYEADHAMLVNTSKDVKGSLADNTAVSGLALIVDRYTIQEDSYDKPTVVAVAEHCDYDNAAKEMVTFKVAYYIRPVRNLLAMQTLFQVNREAVITGYLIDYDTDNNRFVCDVTGINLTVVREAGRSSTTTVKTKDTGQTPSGRARGKFFKKGKIDSQSNKHTIATEGVDEANSVKGSKRPKK
ncbi:uncharacterized protein MELLADRAFT_70116 [Melampsora larici-populina 98AG31]|uniref:Uncharacterized protein n=1 Tax=Melampsora larici-populina (strain 98AG31 / pathotype 3-4-7) TaxID=747676 RepID=F4SDM5_MELLP|nr:uncharacterized protein MELLADRAFT_70116 [Melampsora larici-populina 98AG31]EGF97250.1 hypothetical protein MELLADRAFT_70116 [Melampsora larici-populina 98AG31]